MEKGIREGVVVEALAFASAAVAEVEAVGIIPVVELKSVLLEYCSEKSYSGNADHEFSRSLSFNSKRQCLLHPVAHKVRRPSPSALRILLNYYLQQSRLAFFFPFPHLGWDIVWD